MEALTLLVTGFWLGYALAKKEQDYPQSDAKATFVIVAGSLAMVLSAGLTFYWIGVLLEELFR